MRYFRRHGLEPFVILPHRVRDGYGLKKPIIEMFGVHGTTLLITVDTGVTAITETEEAQRWGMDVIITDHHHLHAELPRAYALLHPALVPNFPLPFPSGAGVAHALVQALEGGDEWEDAPTDRALAMIGTIADLVELRGLNRTLVQQGLQALSALSTGPLATLVTDVLRTSHRTLTSTDIAFRIAPRINAAGRMEDPLIALTALLEGGEALTTLETLNVRRQESTQSLLEEALATLGLPARCTPSLHAELPPFLAIASTSFPEGIIGLIAGKLTETFGRPSLVATVNGRECTASLRSTSAYHITEGLERCRDLLTSFGGHAQAAGCSLPAARFDELHHRLHADIEERVSEEELLPQLTIDGSLHASTVTLAFCERLREIEPFGQGNLEPLFVLPDVRIESPRRVGNEGAHLQGRIAGIKTIGFKLGHLLEHTERPLDIACHLRTDTWNGVKAPQIFLEDLRAAEHAPELINEEEEAALTST